jgi:hypothetical protein
MGKSAGKPSKALRKCFVFQDNHNGYCAIRDYTMANKWARRKGYWYVAATYVENHDHGSRVAREIVFKHKDNLVLKGTRTTLFVNEAYHMSTTISLVNKVMGCVYMNECELLAHTLWVDNFMPGSYTRIPMP